MNQDLLYIEQYYSNKGVSQKYGNSQVSTFKAFLKYCSDNNLKPREFTSEEAYEYLEYLKTRISRLGIPISNSRINNYLVVASIYYNELCKTNVIRNNPFAPIGRLPIDKITNSYGANPIDVKDVAKLFDAASTFRERVILHLFYSLGLRRSEAQEVKESHIDFRNKELKVVNGKGEKKRLVPIPTSVLEDIKTYLFDEREMLLNGKFSEYLVVSRLSQHTSGGTMYKVVKELAEEALPVMDVSPHRLRASIGTHMIESGVKGKYVQRILGHSSNDTTYIYTHKAK